MERMGGRDGWRCTYFTLTSRIGWARGVMMLSLPPSTITQLETKKYVANGG